MMQNETQLLASKKGTGRWFTNILAMILIVSIFISGFPLMANAAGADTSQVPQTNINSVVDNDSVDYDAIAAEGLTKPVLKVKSTTYNSVTLTWNKVSGATKYEIYRATSKSGSYKKIKTQSTRTYKNSSLTTGENILL